MLMRRASPRLEEPFVVFGASPTTVGPGGERRPATHHDTPKYDRPGRCRRRRSRSPGCRNRHWIECRLRELSTEQFLCHRHFDHRAACSDDHLVLRCHLDDRGRSSCRAVLRTGTDAARAPQDAHSGMCNKDHDGHEYHVERLGSREWRSGYGHAHRGCTECSCDRGRVPCGGWRVSRRLSHSFEGRLIDTSDHYFDDSRDDPFVRSANDNDDDRWHCIGRGVTARIRVGGEFERVTAAPP